MELRTARRKNGLLEVSPTIKRLDPKRDAIPYQRAKILRVRECIHRHEEKRLLIFRQNVVQRNRWWDFSDRQNPLKHRETGQGFEYFLFREINRDGLRSRFEQRPEIFQPFVRQHDRDDSELAFEQPPDDFGSFGDENALSLVLQWTPHGGVRLEFGCIEGRDFLNMKHFEDFARYDSIAKKKITPGSTTFSASDCQLNLEEYKLKF